MFVQGVVIRREIYDGVSATIWYRCKETVAFTQRDKWGRAVYIIYDLPSRLFSVYLSDLAIRFSVFRQTLSDTTLDRSKVKSDKLLCVNMLNTLQFHRLWQAVDCGLRSIVEIAAIDARNNIVNCFRNLCNAMQNRPN